MAFAGPAIVHHGNPNHGGVGGRHGVGGGGGWKRGGLRADSHMVGKGMNFQQHNMAPEVDEDEQAKHYWQGRGVGRGPLWPEGGPRGKAGFRENVGWTGSFARGEGPAPANRDRAGDKGDEKVPATDAHALLQVFRSPEVMKEEVAVQHRFSIGREEGCSLKLQWDGMSRRHAFLE
eukprot:3007702-Rhodomonas_salina.4